MGTTRTFQDMLNEYLPNELLAADTVKRDWFLSNCQKDNKWKGGDIIVPFYGAQASSVKFGGLTAQADISQFKPVRGKISGYKEVWGSLIFNQTDIMQHDGTVKEASFLKILPDQIDAFTEYMKMAISINLLCGPHFAKVTDSTNAATGKMIVDRIDRFELGQKCYIKDDDSNELAVYVIGILVDASEVEVSATRGGAAADVSAYTAAANAKFYHDGVIDTTAHTIVNPFTSLKSALLSATNGGSTNLHGVAKTAYPYLQAINVSAATLVGGGAMTAANILTGLFNAYNQVKIKARGANMSKCVMSWKHLGEVMAAIESQKAAFKVTAGQTKASLFGWTEIEIFSVKGSFTVIGVQEMDDDVIYFLDMSAFTFRTNGFFRKNKNPDGNEYYTVRAETGYQYIVDICLFGELEVTKPSSCAVIYGVNT